MNKPMRFRDQSLCTDMPESGPFEDQNGEVGFSIFVSPTPYERETLLFRDELLAMVAAIDAEYPPETD